MASQNPDLFIPRLAEADMRTYQYRIVTKGAQPGGMALATATSYPLGVLQDKPKQGEYGSVAVDDILKVKVAGAVNELDYCGSDANGNGVAVTTGTALGVFLDAGVSGDVVRILVDRTKLS